MRMFQLSAASLRPVAATVSIACLLYLASAGARAADEQTTAPNSKPATPEAAAKDAQAAPSGPTANEPEKPVAPAAGGGLPKPAAVPAEQKTSGVELRIGFGPALPSGSATGASRDSLSNYFGTLWAVDIDLGYRFSSNWFLGVYIAGTPWNSAVGDSFRTACAASGVSCSAKDGRFGVMGAYHFNPSGPTDLWLGFGLAYEVATFEAGSTQGQLSGTEFRSILGVDFNSFGLFLDLPIGVYQTAESSGKSQSISQTGMHSWPRIGVEYRLY